MSTTSLVLFDGDEITEIEFRNSWGGAARIWNSLFEKYVKNPRKEYDSWLMDPEGRLWKLIDDERLSPSERAVLAFTFDNAVISSANFARMAAALREFETKFPTIGVNHLPAWAGVFDTFGADFIGLYATSVGEHPWVVFDDEKEEYISYDIKNGDKHWEVFNEYPVP